MNDRIKHKQMNNQTADTKVNASVFLFFCQRTFFKNNFCQRTNGTFAFAPTHKANPSAKAKEPFFLPTHQVILIIFNAIQKQMLTNKL